jgi:hypothetical protein
VVAVVRERRERQKEEGNSVKDEIAVKEERRTVTMTTNV